MNATSESYMLVKPREEDTEYGSFLQTRKKMKNLPLSDSLPLFWHHRSTYRKGIP